MKNKSISLSLALIIGIIVIPCVSPAETTFAQRSRPPLPKKPTVKKLAIKFMPARQTFAATDSLIIRFEIKNESDTPMRFLIWGTPFEGFSSDMFDIKKEGIDGEEIPYRGKLVSRSGPHDTDYITLGKGQTASRELDLSEAYDIKDKGDYVLNHRLRTIDVELNKGKRGAALWKPRKHDMSLPSIKFKVDGTRQLKNRPVPRTAPAYPTDIRQRGRHFAQAPGQQTATDGSRLATTPNCNLNYFMMPQYEIQSHESAFQEEANKAFCEALQKVAEAKVILNGTPRAEVARGLDRYEAYFGSSEKNAILNVIAKMYKFGVPPDGTLDTPVKFISAIPAECRSQDPSHEAFSQYIAYVKADEIQAKSKNIYLCKEFWNLQRTQDSHSKAGVILHELAHLTMGAKWGEGGGSARTVVYDYQYFEAGCLFLAQSDPVHSAYNADSFARFVMNRNDFSAGLDRPHIRLSNAFGETAVIEQNALKMRAKPNPVKSIFALSNPKESKLIFPSDNNDRCRNPNAFNYDCWECDDPDLNDLNSTCDSSKCDCLVKINPSWQPYSPVSGDSILLVSSDRASVVQPPVSPGGPLRADTATATSPGLTLIKTSTTDSRLKNGDEIVLQTPQGLYLSVANNGDIIARNADRPGNQDKFSMSYINDSRYYVQFRSMGKRYISVSGSWTGIGAEKYITADERDSTDCPNCTFILVNNNGPELKHGDVINIMTNDGSSYVTVKNSYLTGFVEIESANEGIQQAYIIRKDNWANDRIIRTGDTVTLTTESEECPLWTGSQGIGQLYGSCANFNELSQEDKNKRSKFSIELGR